MATLPLSTTISRSVLPKGAKAVALALSEHANKDRECWPSVQLLMAETDMSRASVHRALTHLVDLNLISREGRTRPDGSTGANLYRLHASAFRDLPKASEQARKMRRGGLTVGQGGSQGETGGSHTETPQKPALNPAVEHTAETNVSATERFAPVIEIDFQKGTRVRYDIDDGPEVENPFAQMAAERIGRKERDVKRWNWSDVAKDFGAESSRFYPMVPGRTNTAAVASVLKRESIKSSLTPELAVSMIDAFFWDRRHIVDGVHIWKQFLTALPRLQARALATIDLPREQRQGTSDLEPVRERESSSPFAAQRAWLLKYGEDTAVVDEMEAEWKAENA